VIHSVGVVQTPSGDWERLHWDWFTEPRGGLYRDISISKRNFSRIWVNPNLKVRVALSLRATTLESLTFYMALLERDTFKDYCADWLEALGSHDIIL
jgi:hypothetical protein